MKKVKHPLLDSHSPHYVDADGTHNIAILEETQTVEQQIGWCKGNIGKYKLRLHKKGEEWSDRRKMQYFHRYLALLNDMAGKIGNDKYTITVASAYARCNIEIIFEYEEEE